MPSKRKMFGKESERDWTMSVISVYGYLLDVKRHRSGSEGSSSGMRDVAIFAAM